MTEAKRPLKVFLSYASQDKPVVRELSRRLASEGWIDPWVDEKKLLPGQDWRLKIEEAVEDSDIVIICLSSNSVTKEGYVQKELRYAREIALEKPDDAIFLVPLRLGDCEVPRGLRFYQWADYFGETKEETYDVLLESLKLRYEQKLKLEAEEHARREKAERERIALEEQASRDAKEKARLEAEERARRQREIRERKTADEKDRKESEPKAREQAEERVRVEKGEKARKGSERAAWEKEKHEAGEKAKREREERQVVQIEEIKATVSKFVTGFKSSLPKAIPSLRIAGFAGIAIALIWAGSWGLPKLASFVPTAKTSLTSTLRPSATSSISPPPPTKTLTPKSISTKTQTPVPTPLPTEITDANGVAMVLVPAGEFIMGSEDGDEDEKPVREVYLDAFYMDKHEVTNSLYKACVDSGVCKSPAPSKDFDGRKYFGNTQFDDYPVTYIEWDQADIYCSWREAKLPTEAQWEKAARSTDGRTFPWGESINCDLANYNPACVGGMKKVGSYESGKSLYGIYDLAGNVWEWVADWYSPTSYQDFPISNPSGPENGEFRILRGGAWNAEMSKTRASYRFELSSIYFNRAFGDSSYWPAWAATPSDANLAFYAGFRCAKDPNP